MYEAAATAATCCPRFAQIRRKKARKGPGVRTATQAASTSMPRACPRPCTPGGRPMFARMAAGRGIKVIIAGAGGAAHLAGVIAAETTIPVIGVPIPSTSLQGMDSLLSIVQMPARIPVATVAIGKPGATNAGILAAQIIGLSNSAVAGKLNQLKAKLAKSVEEKSQKLQQMRRSLP